MKSQAHFGYGATATLNWMAVTLHHYQSFLLREPFEKSIVEKYPTLH